MSVAGVLARGNLAQADVHAGDRPVALGAFARVATSGLAVLVLVAPFEALRPLLRVPGQSLSTVEVALLLVLSAGATAFIASRAWRSVATGDLLAWGLFVAAAFVAALLAPSFRSNAVHMAARVGLAAAVWVLAAAGARSEAARRRVVSAVFASGVAVAVLTIADFSGVEFAERALTAFRDGVAVVGAQVRASGPFQYPTIASMYLEMAFAIGLGLLASVSERPPLVALAVVAGLGLIAEGVVLTFTRSGLITLVLSMLCVAGIHWRRGPTRTTRMVALLAAIFVAELFSSRSAEMLMLRLTSEGQGQWFSAVFDTPSSVTLDTRRPIEVPVTVTNTGRATWDSDASEPVMLSYHWVAADSDEVVAWEGERTSFDTPVRPGRTVTLNALVGGPGRPGEFRLLWDIEQERRLWFSTEPEAILAFSSGTVTGPVTSLRLPRGPKRIPRMAVRPGRLILWGAALRMLAERPLLGVGPDNYRLLYGRYSTLKTADPRVHSNNMYVEVVAGTGLVGLLAFGWLGLRSARAALAASTSGGIGTGIGAACLAIAVHGLADSFLSFTGTYILIAVTLGLATACAATDGRDAHRV